MRASASVSSEGPERLSALALTSPVLTALYYLLPASIQRHLAIVFLPQIIAYLCLLVWIMTNRHPLPRLGLCQAQLAEGLRWGIPTGLVLGTLNVSVILWGAPTLGEDISFLRETPHARIPTALMLPWTIVAIAILVELNFRGFLLGRLLTLWQQSSLRRYHVLGGIIVVTASALVFAFDPFMVVTFKHLHWIAFWDGILWGSLQFHLRNLYVPIVAHAMEVVILYIILKQVLTP